MTVSFKTTSSLLGDNRAYMVDHADEIQLPSLSRFFMSVKKFYEAATSKMLAKFPFKDLVVSGLRFLRNFQTTPAMDLPSFTEGTRADVFWGEVLAMKIKITNTPRFLLMSRIVRAVMTSHSRLYC